MVVGSALIVTTMLGRPGLASAEDGDVPRPTASAAEGAGGATGRYVDQQGLEVWGVYDGHDLDQYLFRSAGPINFDIDLKRDFGPVDENGHPAITNELYGTTSKLTLRVWDVDEDYSGTTFEPERDTVWVNGVELIGFLSGASDQWSIATFDVPSFLLHCRRPAIQTARMRSKSTSIPPTAAATFGPSRSIGRNSEQATRPLTAWA